MLTKAKIALEEKSTLDIGQIWQANNHFNITMFQQNREIETVEDKK